jgi:hypothetical protein
MTTGQIVLGVVGAVAGYFTGGAGFILMGAALGYAAGTYIDPATSDMPSPGTPQMHELDVPTIEEGMAVFDLLGTSRVIGHIFWYGKARTKAIKEKQGGGKGGGKSKKVTVGYEYYLSWAQGIILGELDTLWTVLRDEEVVWSGELNKPESGGEETITLEGMGSMTLYFGTNDQTQNSVMAAEEGTSVTPTYRGLCYAFFDDCFIGSYNRAPRIRFVLTKRPSYAFNFSESIGTYDYNPAHAIYHVLTHHQYVGFPTTWVNEESFSTFADLFTGEYEQHGLSMLLSRQEGALRTIESVLTHAGAVLRYGIDGKFHLHALRAYEDISSLPSITQDDFTEPLAFERKGWTEVANEVQVQHHERYDMDAGVVAVTGEYDPEDTFEYTGTPDTEKWVVMFAEGISDTDGSNVPTVTAAGLTWAGALIVGSEYEQHRVNSLWCMEDTYNVADFTISTRVDFATISSAGTNDTDYIDVFRFGFADTKWSAESDFYVYTCIRLYRNDRITIYHKSKNLISDEYELDEDDFPIWLRLTRKRNLPSWIYFTFGFNKGSGWMNAEDGTEDSGDWSASYESPRHVYASYQFSTIPSGSGVTTATIDCSAEPFYAPVATSGMICYDASAYSDSFYGDDGDPPDVNKWTIIEEGDETALNGYFQGALSVYLDASPVGVEQVARLRSNITLEGDFSITCNHRGIDNGRSDNQTQETRGVIVVWDLSTMDGWAVGLSRKPGTYIPAPFTNHWDIQAGTWIMLTNQKQQTAQFTYGLRRVGSTMYTSVGGSSWRESAYTCDKDLVFEFYEWSSVECNQSAIHTEVYSVTFTGDDNYCTTLVPQTALNIRRSAVTADDRGTAEIHGRAVTRSVQLMMYGTKENANWAADRAARRAAYPFAEGNATVNRNAFKYEVGDLFRLSDSEHNISNMVCRAMNIGEGDINKEDITISFMEEPDYVTSSATLAAVTTEGSARDFGLDVLTEMDIIEAPYSLVGEEIVLIPLAGRKKGTEVGYEIWMSIDGGTSYSYLDDATYYASHGTLVAELNVQALTLEKELTFEIDASFDDDFSEIETITRTEMLNNGNLSLLGTEILNFETITPDAVTEGRYEISNLSRGRFDSIRQTWAADEDFWHVGTTSLKLLRDTAFVKGAVLYFKYIPYNEHFIGELSEATAISYTIVGRAFAPYVVENFRASGKGGHPVYGKDIYLTWSPRVRGVDAGINNPDEVIDASPTHEGYFEVVVKNAVGTTVRTATSLSAYNWEYSQTMNESDNGSLEDELTFQVDNYKSDTGVRYDNIHSRTLVVERISSTTTTTTVTTTSTTVTGSTTTTTV